MYDEKPSASPSPWGKVWGSLAQAAGVLGVSIGVALAVAVLVLRGRTFDRVDEIAERVDAGLARGLPLFASARERMDGMSEFVEAVGASVKARAETAGADSDAGKALLAKATAVSDRYAAMRAAYASAREQAIAALGRLETVDRMLPAVEMPRGPVEALASLDDRIRALDADVLGLLSAVPEAGSGPLADAVVERVKKVEAALRAASSGIGDAGTRLDAFRGKVAATADRVRRLVTALAVALVLVFLYAALLHAVLFREGRRLRRGVAAG